ncbi:hypothetical protein QUF72_09335 [Desulfobacterales bacterium HSG2]|nr:hypothetical protein [Desulfobacterales bacterium HSG2]
MLLLSSEGREAGRQAGRKEAFIRTGAEWSEGRAEWSGGRMNASFLQTGRNK